MSTEEAAEKLEAAYVELERVFESTPNPVSVVWAIHMVVGTSSIYPAMTLLGNPRYANVAKVVDDIQHDFGLRVTNTYGIYWLHDWLACWKTYVAACTGDQAVAIRLPFLRIPTKRNPDPDPQPSRDILFLSRDGVEPF